MWHGVQRVPSTTLSGSDSPSQTVSNQTVSNHADAAHMDAAHMDLAHAANGQRPNGTGHASQGDSNGSASPGSDAELPQVDAKMIPLSVTISRLITFAYTELVTLVDTLPARADADRRAEILKYTDHMTDLLTKLLVLVRWAKHAPQIQKCQNVIAYLDSQNRYFEYAVDGIYATFMSMPNVRMRNYDVGNAAEILSTGSYQRLPAAISRAVPPPRLGRKHVRETLAAIGGIIRSRILRGEPVPLAMRRYTIANGRIVFTVPGEFEATLTLLQYEDDIPWHVVGVRVLVAGDASLPDEQQITVNTRQIVEVAQQILIAATNSDAESNPPQLVQFYDFLHRQCYTVLLETVLKQAAVLLRARWENLLHVEMPAGNRTVLVLRYWTLSRAAAAADPSKQQQQGDKGNSIVFRLTALPVPRPIHASALQGADQEDPEFELVEHDRRNLIPKIGLAVTWTAHSGLASPKVWTRTVSHADELATSGAETNDTPDFDLVLDPSSVNTERLLRQVTWQHARAILKSLHTQMLDSQLFGESAVELLYTAASGVSKRELTHDEALACTAVPCLRAWYRQNEGAVDITVDTYTGRLVVRASEAVATSTSLSEAMVGQLTDQLNRQPWRVAALLVDMRSSLALADLDCLVHRSLGLRPQNNPQGMNSPALPGFVLSSVSLRTETAAHASQQQPQQQQQPVASSSSSSSMATSFPLRISQQEADALAREVAGSENPLSRMRFYMVEGTEGVEEQVGPVGSAKGEWYIMVVMTDRLQFRLVLLNPHPTDRLLFVVGQIISLQVDRLFSSVARRLLMEGKLERAAFSREAPGGQGGSRAGLTSSVTASEREITEKVDAMLTGRTSITLDYLNALASMCRARLALRLLQTQLTRWKIPYSFRLPSFSTSPHGHRAAVSSELSVVELDKMGLYELDEQVPVLYIPISGLMRASPINWSVASQGVLPDEARRMVSVRIASDELDPSLRADLSSSTRVDQHRQAAIAAMEGRAQARPRASYASLSNAAAGAGGRSLIGRHVIPCQVVASIPVALDGLPAPVARAYADAVHFGANAAADGGYHRDDSGQTGQRGPHRDEAAQGRDEGQRGYSKVVLVYKQVNRALQCLIRDWSEQHLMTHVGRHMRVWETRALRRVLASTAAFYPFSAGPYTGAVANMLGSWRGHQSAEMVVQCIGSCFVSISCRVPFPFASEDGARSLYPPGYGDSGGNDLSFHLTLADIDSKTNRINRIASTWPWVFAHSARGADEWSRAGQRSVGFEVSTSLSRWLRTLQAQLNLTGNPLTALSMIIQLMPIHHIIGSMSAEQNIPSLVPSLQYDAQDALIRFRLKSLLSTGDDDAAQADDRSHMLLHKLAALPKDVSRAFASVRGLQIMHMYTAVDNIRLVFNSRYVVDLRLVSNDLFHISDAVQTANIPSKRATSVAPEPLVTATTEPIPLFADWLAAMSREMRFDWERLERGMAIILRDVVPRGGEARAHVDAREKVRLFQRQMFSLRPGATKAERFFHGFRQMLSRQSSTRSPTFVALPPAAILCVRLHLVPVLRSLMQWLVQSVHVRDQLEMAISRTQEIIGDAAPHALLSVREKLVFMSELNKDADKQGGQVMIVGFTGAKESVRCEFLVQAGVAGKVEAESNSMDVDTPRGESTEPTQTVESNEAAEPNETAESNETAELNETADSSDSDNPAFGANDEIAIHALMSDLFTIPADLMHVDLDVRIVPMTRPPNGITDAAAAFLVHAFKTQAADIRQRAGVLVRILALPPQLVMDVVDIARKLEGKAEICALRSGLEHMVRLDAAKCTAYFVVRVCRAEQWTQLVVAYELLLGSAHVECVFDSTHDCASMDEQTYMGQSSQALKPWAERMAAVVAALDSQTAFTRDMGKTGKSRLYDIMHGLASQ